MLFGSFVWFAVQNVMCSAQRSHYIDMACLLVTGTSSSTCTQKTYFIRSRVSILYGYISISNNLLYFIEVPSGCDHNISDNRDEERERERTDEQQKISYARSFFFALTYYICLLKFVFISACVSHKFSGNLVWTSGSATLTVQTAADTHTRTLKIYWYIFKVMYACGSIILYVIRMHESLIIQRVCNQCFRYTHLIYATCLF